MTKALTLHYERKLYMLADTAINRGLIGEYLEFFQYPDGRIEIRAGAVSLPYSMYDKLGAVDQGAIVDNKRLSHVLQISVTCSPSATADQSAGLQLPIVRTARLCRDTSSPAPRPNGNCPQMISRLQFSPRPRSRKNSDGFEKRDCCQPRLGSTGLLTLCERQTARCQHQRI